MRFSPPNNTTARLMQTITDGDFSLEVKMDSPLSGNSTNFNPTQGILVESLDGNRWLRAEFTSQGDGTRLNVVTHERTGTSIWSKTSWLSEVVAPDGVQPLVLRVQRYGSRFLISTKIAEGDWVERVNLPLHMLKAGKAGIYAGNSASSPSPQEFTAQFDSFEVSGVEMLRSDSIKNSLTWSITGQGNLALQPVFESYPCDTVVEVTAVPDERWSFSHWGGELTGTDVSTSILMDAPKQISASFSQYAYLVDFDHQW
jgi:regulation of enolase protein 1 (concanavalin A-like superfamily)